MIETAVSIAFQPVALVIIVLTSLLVRPIARYLVSRYNCRFPSAAGLIFTLGAILVITLTPDDRVAMPSPLEGGLLFQQFASPAMWWQSVQAIGDGLERMANVGLFFPLGFFGYAVSRKAVTVVAMSALMSLAIELTQTSVGRSGDLADLLNNVTGAILGALVAAVVAYTGKSKSPAA